MLEIEKACVESYRRHKHLKKVGEELGVPWQTVYVHLRNAGEPVFGDKARYGAASDKVAAVGERLFLRYVPIASNLNDIKFQSKYDFDVLGYKVDVKTCQNRRTDARWAFSVKKQRVEADFFVCFAVGQGCLLEACLLIPGEVARNHGTISLNKARNGKWWDYQVDPESLSDFFRSLPEKPRINGEAA